tara:strand:+ start:2383 stop:2880 length:498 start_codon:yes stop_codon:yes gene_type:complete
MYEQDDQPEKVTCKHCGGHRCYKEDTTLPEGDSATSYMCVDCGYTTTSLNVEGSPTITQYEEHTAKLIKDLRWVDDKNLVWYPIVLNFPSVGIIFPDGNNKLDWWWTTAPSVDVKEEEKEKYPIPGSDGMYYNKRVDINKKEKFASTQFYEACKSVGFIINEDVV